MTGTMTILGIIGIVLIFVGLFEFPVFLVLIARKLGLVEPGHSKF